MQSSLLSASAALERHTECDVNFNGPLTPSERRGWTLGGDLLEPSAMGRKGVPVSQGALTGTVESQHHACRPWKRSVLLGVSAMRQGGEAGTWVEGGLLRRQ